MVFLLIAFATELAIMQGLPVVFPDLAWWHLAAVDAALLTIILAVPAWLIFLVPLERSSRARGRLLQRLLSIQEEEQERIARDLHDGIGQSLTALLMRLKLLESEPVPPAVESQLATLREIVTSTVAELRRMVREGRPPALADLGLQPALQQQLTSFAEGAPFGITLDWQLPVGSRPPASVETAVYRIVGEAVTNAAKYAEASQVRVTIDRVADGVRARVADNGGGFSRRATTPDDRQSFGILGMRERAAALGGSLRIESQPGRGSTVEVIIPCDCGGFSSRCCRVDDEKV